MLIVELVDKINAISQWRRSDERAPHKPLMLLYVLSKYRKDMSAYSIMPKKWMSQLEAPITGITHFGDWLMKQIHFGILKMEKNVSFQVAVTRVKLTLLYTMLGRVLMQININPCFRIHT